MWHNKDKITLWIKKAKGMLDKILDMVEKDVYCADIAGQISATQWLLKEANRQLLKNHLMCCGKSKLTSSNSHDVEGFVDELVKVWDISTRK